MKVFLIVFLTLGLYSSILSSPLKNTEEIIFFPTYAYTDSNKNVQLNIHTWVFKPETTSIRRSFVTKGLISIFHLKDNDFVNEQFKTNSFYFMVDNKRGKDITITIGNLRFALAKTQANGHSDNRLSIPHENLQDHIHANAISFKAATANQSYTGKTYFIPPTGTSVISDIDDTIKISMVLNKKELAKNTFTRPFQPVPGMARYYKNLHKQGAVFHYVSGSPWQLYVPLIRFLQKNGFPEGSCHMKYFRLKDSSSLKFIAADQQAYKIKLIEAIIKDFPLRKYILIGDSGESDPEVYAHIAQKFPNQISAIYIRDVGSKTKNPLRYKKLFSRIKGVKWKIFTHVDAIK